MSSQVTKINNIEEYLNKINNSEDFFYGGLKRISKTTYSRDISSNTVIYSFDYGDLYSDVCFGSLYRMIGSDVFSSNYLVRLPYTEKDERKDLHHHWLDYENIYKELSNLVKDTLDFKVHNTDFLNIKLITMEHKVKLSSRLTYALSLLMFCLLRSTEGEYLKYWKNYNSSYKVEYPTNLYELLCSISRIGLGGHHNVNDSLDKLLKNYHISEELKNNFATKYLDIMNKAFGEGGLINNPKFQIYFDEIYETIAGSKTSHLMQTRCFDVINRTVNRLVLEEKLK